RGGNAENAVVGTGDGHGDDVAAGVDDGGAFEGGIEADIQLDALIDFAAAAGVPCGAGELDGAPDRRGTAERPANHSDGFTNAQQRRRWSRGGGSGSDVGVGAATADTSVGCGA